MKTSFCLMLCGSVLVVPLDAAVAQGAGNVLSVSRDPAAPVAIRPGDYYTHVQVDVPHFAVPSDDDGRKRVGEALLNAFGLGKKTRSITITLTLSYSGNALPEIPLMTYSFDGEKRITKYDYVAAYLSPRWQVGSATPISAKVNYRFSEQASYDPNAITERVSQAIPSDAIVTTLSGPLIQGVAGLTASAFQIANSREVTAGVQDSLFPYGSSLGGTGLTFTIKTPQGSKLADIRARLVVTPTLGRTPVLVTAATAADLKKPDHESLLDLKLNLSGGERLLMEEAKGFAEYAAAEKDKQVGLAQKYCAKSNKTFLGYGLTRMDRTTVIYQSLLDAGYVLTDNEWLLTCFPDPGDRYALTAARSASFALVKPPKPEPLDPQGLKWPPALKDAMGCWVTDQTGRYCQNKAPGARMILERAMLDEIRVGVIDLPGIDLSTLPPGRLWSKSRVLDAIGGKAQEFRCYDHGLVLISDAAPFTLGVAMEGDKIASVQILKATPEAERCLPVRG